MRSYHIPLSALAVAICAAGVGFSLLSPTPDALPDAPRAALPPLLARTTPYHPYPALEAASEAPVKPRRAQRPMPRPNLRLTGEAKCLESAIYHEARSESRAGQLAVADVIVARTRSPRWPSTICNVVKQRAQFSFVVGRVLPREHEPRARWNAAVLARDILAGNVPLPMLGADHYHTTGVHPGWSLKMEKIATIGAHVFFKEGKRI